MSIRISWAKNTLRSTFDARYGRSTQVRVQEVLLLCISGLNSASVSSFPPVRLCRTPRRCRWQILLRGQSQIHRVYSYRELPFRHHPRVRIHLPSSFWPSWCFLLRCCRSPGLCHVGGGYLTSILSAPSPSPVPTYSLHTVEGSWIIM